MVIHAESDDMNQIVKRTPQPLNSYRAAANLHPAGCWSLGNTGLVRAHLWFLWLVACSIFSVAMGCRPAKDSQDKKLADSHTTAEEPAKSNPPTSPLAEKKTEPSQLTKLVFSQFEMPRQANPGYVGPQACGECHESRLEECLSSSHFRTCRAPEESTMPRGFDAGNGSFQLPKTDVRFEMERREERYYQKVRHLDASASSMTESTIDLILGAGKDSDEVYLSWHNDNTLWELPVAWVYADDCWGASGFDRHGGGDHARPLTLRCFECHNTWFEHVPGTLAEYQRDNLISGVTCERCHGPGQAHVDFHRQHPEESVAKHVVLPSELPRERLLEVCTQCHGNAIRHRGPALGFRPGEELEDHYRWVDPPHSEDDHVANQIKYLRQSKCFQQSEMTCITCHDPHLTDEPSTGTSFTTNCTGCHQVDHCSKRPQLPDAVRDQCVDCHMRPYVKINVNFDLVDDSYVPPTRRYQHNISIDEIATNEVLLRWHRSQTTDEAATRASELEQQLIDDWLQDAESAAQSGRYRGAIASVREALIISPNATSLREKLKEYVAQQTQLDADLSSAENAMRNNQDALAHQLYSAIVQRQPNDALALGKLGTLDAKLGDMTLAKQRLGKVVEIDPDEQYGLSMLAWFALLEKDYTTAAKLYEQADAIEPFNAKILFLWGEALARNGNFAQALERYQDSLKSNPRQLDTLRKATLAAAAIDEFSKSLEFATKAVQLTEYSDLSDLKLLAELQWQIGNSEQAEAVGAHMLTIVQHSPQTVEDIKRWIDSNRSSAKK